MYLKTDILTFSRSLDIKITIVVQSILHITNIYGPKTTEFIRMTITNTAGAYTVTSLLDSSSSSYAKAAGYSLTTYEKEDGDVEGPFSLAISAENAKEGSLIWIGTDYLLDDQYNSYSSGANLDFFTNAISWKLQDSKNLGIKSKSLDYNYLTISASSATVIKIILIGIIPIGYLLYGIDEVVRRRKVSLE